MPNGPSWLTQRRAFLLVEPLQRGSSAYRPLHPAPRASLRGVIAHFPLRFRTSVQSSSVSQQQGRSPGWKSAKRAKATLRQARQGETAKDSRSFIPIRELSVCYSYQAVARPRCVGIGRNRELRFLGRNGSFAALQRGADSQSRSHGRRRTATGHNRTFQTETKNPVEGGLRGDLDRESYDAFACFRRW